MFTLNSNVNIFLTHKHICTYFCCGDRSGSHGTLYVRAVLYRYMSNSAAVGGGAATARRTYPPGQARRTKTREQRTLDDT